MSVWRATRRRWLDFWFCPERPDNLGLCRLLFYGAIFLLYLPRDLALWGEVSPVFWMPLFTFEALRLPVAPAGVLAALAVAWKVALGLGCLGLFTRLSTATSFVLGFYLLGLPHNFGKVHHFDALLVFVFGALAFARCGDAWAVDALIRRRRGGAAPKASGEYRWPVRLVWVLFALIFFAAGLAKLRASGPAWVLSDNMAALLIAQQYPTSEPGPLVDWGLALARRRWLYQPLAAATLLLELGYPLALVSRRARWIVVPGMLLAQIGIRVLLGPSFEQFVICNLFWVPWDRLAWRAA